MAPIELSTHFIDNWRRRVGNGATPTPAGVKNIMDDAVRIARGYALAAFEPHRRSLAIYWHPELNLVLTVDDRRGVAVSVLTPDMSKRGNPQ